MSCAPSSPSRATKFGAHPGGTTRRHATSSCPAISAGARDAPLSYNNGLPLLHSGFLTLARLHCCLAFAPDWAAGFIDIEWQVFSPYHQEEADGHPLNTSVVARPTMADRDGVANRRGRSLTDATELPGPPPGLPSKRSRLALTDTRRDDRSRPSPARPARSACQQSPPPCQVRPELGCDTAHTGEPPLRGEGGRFARQGPQCSRSARRGPRRPARRDARPPPPQEDGPSTVAWFLARRPPLHYGRQHPSSCCRGWHCLSPHRGALSRAWATTLCACSVLCCRLE